MKAAVLVAPRSLRMVECSIPIPGPRQVLIRVEACGVCASNLPRWEGRPWFEYPTKPGEMGHEGIGRIAAVGDEVTNWQEGERVSFLSNHAYAQYDVADAEALVSIPLELEEDCLPGEPLGCAWNIFQRAGIVAGDQVAVVGVGFLGALLMQLAMSAGARVIAVARRPFCPAVAHALAGADVIIASDFSTAVAEISRMTRGRLCDVVIEATGKQEPLDAAAAMTRERGRLVIAGYHQDGARKVDMQLWNWRGLDVINAHEREASIYINGIRSAFDAVQEDLFDPGSFITHHLPLHELGEAFDLAIQRPVGFMKAIVHP